MLFKKKGKQCSVLTKLHEMQKLPFVVITDSSSSGLSLVRPIRRMSQHLLLHLLILSQLVSELFSSCLKQKRTPHKKM
jgi:hypothetical protein